MKNERTQMLLKSLVGASIEFKFGKYSDATSIEENIKSEKRKIAKNLSLAFESGKGLCVALLGEMLSYYMKETYYMAVRSSLELRRYRPRVMDYLKLSIDEREKFLIDQLNKKVGDRDAKVEAVRYFLSTYKGRIKNFRPYLNKEEFLIVA